ncbi:MAG TPA: hypothetical protein VKW08_00745 [Xanthobacteraceae bacterium]|nr:hypothetical protein [Xanthobacteraceae bacterium]
MITPVIGQRVRIPIRTRGGEPSIREMLSDAIVIAVMQADHVDPAALEAELRGLACRQAD